MPISSGTRLGPYEITAPAGQGGMGEVYRARDTRLQRSVAIKILSAQLSSDPARKQRFEREAKTISSLNHPHICVLYDIGSQDGTDYLVMECIEGETLAKRLEDISKEVTAKLRLKLTGEQKEALSRRPTQNIEAYQLYLRGRFYWNKRTAEGFNSAIGYFQQAIEKDPNYALAYTGLADCYNLLGSYGHVPPRETYAHGKAAATRALGLDEKLAEAHASLAFNKLLYDWDWSGARRELDRAIELNPNYAPAYAWYNIFYLAMGHPGDGLREVQRALELDPLSLVTNSELGRVLLFQHQYERAIEQERKTLELDANFDGAHVWLGVAYLEIGKYADAIREGQTAKSIVHRGRTWLLARAYVKSGEIGNARKTVEELEVFAKERYVPAYEMALANTGLEDTERAFAWLEKAYEERSLRPDFRADLMFEDLHLDRRFQELLRRMGLPQ